MKNLDFTKYSGIRVYTFNVVVRCGTISHNLISTVSRGVTRKLERRGHWLHLLSFPECYNVWERDTSNLVPRLYLSGNELSLLAIADPVASLY